MGGAEDSRSTGTGRPTSRDVARLAGVSHTAVSFVFNGRAEGNLSPATQERIRQAAAQLGYRPDPLARGLRRRRTAVIGLVTDEIASSPFAGRLLRGAMETAWGSDHLVLTVDSGGDPAKEDAAVAELSGLCASRDRQRILPLGADHVHCPDQLRHPKAL